MKKSTNAGVIAAALAAAGGLAILAQAFRYRWDSITGNWVRMRT
jgi:hypothetical protein